MRHPFTILVAVAVAVAITGCAGGPPPKLAAPTRWDVAEDPAGDDYFPLDAFGAPLETKYIAARYAKLLAAMHEPSMLSLARHGGAAYRLLWIRGASQALVVRVDSQGTARTLTVKRLSAGDGDAPPRSSLDRSRPLMDDEWTALEAKLAAARFDSLTTNEQVGDAPSHWVLEEAHVGAYHVVDRAAPKLEGDTAPYLEACLAFLAVAGGDVVEGDVY